VKRLFPDTTLAMSAALMESAMSDECDVVEIPETRGRGGVTIKGEPKKIATHPCSLKFAADAIAELRDDAMKINATYVVAMPLLANVQLGHRLVVRGTAKEGSSSNQWQKTVDVVGNSAPHTHRVRRFVFATDAKG
jgi:hypothetical protein